MLYVTTAEKSLHVDAKICNAADNVEFDNGLPMDDILQARTEHIYINVPGSYSMTKGATSMRCPSAAK